jgi:hypothetical protein
MRHTRALWLRQSVYRAEAVVDYFAIRVTTFENNAMDLLVMSNARQSRFYVILVPIHNALLVLIVRKYGGMLRPAWVMKRPIVRANSAHVRI